MGIDEETRKDILGIKGEIYKKTSILQFLDLRVDQKSEPYIGLT